MRLTHRLAAAAIRRHLWQPAPPGHLGGRPWTMGRELRIFDRLARDYDALELVGAIEHLRAVMDARGPLRLTCFIHRQRGRALLSRALAAHHQSLTLRSLASQAPPGPTRGGGFARLSVEPPPPNGEVQP